MVNSIFYNSDYVVVEYIDLIKSPYMVLLSLLRKNPKIKEILRVEEIEDLDDIALYEWYINRRHQNFFVDLNRYPDKISEKQLSDILDEQMSLYMNFYKDSLLLPLGGSLKFIKKKQLVKDVIIYHPHNNLFAKTDLETTLGENFLWYTNFDEVMKKAGSNSTYFLSDIRKIDRMKEQDVLKFSSVTLPIEYRYNKKNMTDFDIDFDSLMKDHTFKLTYMQACRYASE